MFSFTKQERYVISLLVLIMFFGSIARYVFREYPSLNNIVNLIDSDQIYTKVNINTGTFEELVAIPYIGEYTAKNIIHYRQENGPFTEIQQIKKVKGIRDKNYERFFKHIKI